jgi:hypothetical protein
MSKVYLFSVAGVQFHDLHKVMEDLNEGEELDLVLEPENKYDPFAVAIMSEGVMLGYVPKIHSQEISDLVAWSDNVKCIIFQLNPDAKPWNQLIVKVFEEEEVSQR